MQYEITIKIFNRLTTTEVFQLLKLRSQIFVVEQNCAYQDPDLADTEAFHLMVKLENEIIACLRILPPGTVQQKATVIGRLCVEPRYRHGGLAEIMMNRAINFCQKLYDEPIKISAQTYLENFYKKLGFETTSHPYLEDGIEHIIMVKYH